MQWLEEVKKAWAELADQKAESRLFAEFKLGSQLLPLSEWESQTKNLGRDAQKLIEIVQERLEWKLLTDEQELVSAGAAWALGKAAFSNAYKALGMSLNHESLVVKTAAVEALGNLAMQISELKPKIKSIIEKENLRSSDDESLRIAAHIAYRKASDPEPGVPPLELVGRLKEIARSLSGFVDWRNIHWDGGLLGEQDYHHDSIPKVFRGLATFIPLQAGDIQEEIDIAYLVKAPQEEVLKLENCGYFVTEIVRYWNKRYGDAQDVTRLPALPDTLCAFTSNIDAIYYLRAENTQGLVNKLVDEIIEERKMEMLDNEKDSNDEEIRKKVINEVLERYQSIKKNPAQRLKEVRNKSDVLVAILTSFVMDAGKPFVRGYELWQWIDQFFEPKSKIIGGAPAFDANLLTKLTLIVSEEERAKVRIYTPFHSNSQAMVFDPHIQILSTSNGRISDTGYAWKSGRKEDPTKINVSIEHGPLSIQIGGLQIVSSSTDRIIFKAESYYDENGKGITFYPIFMDGERPLLKVEEHDILDQDELILREIGDRYLYLIINGPHYLSEYEEKEKNEIQDAMVGQLTALVRRKTKIHYEFTPSKNLEYLETVIKNLVKSMGVNHEEIQDVAANFGYTLDNKSELYKIYKCAEHVARYLDLERLYVHSHDVDITLRKIFTDRSAATRCLENEINAILFAKKAVTAHMKTRELDIFVIEVVQPKSQSCLLKREAFQKIFEFVAELATEERIISPMERLKFTRDVALQGYYIPEKGDYGVVFAPIKWLYGQLAKEATTTSIGNVSSCVGLWVSDFVR